ncbi:DUF4296 domain-containing protein [Flavobacterium aquatile]|uniref:DUF4296 domain-containing protein n=1 Tax=Flavobacterium aquatile TaxID=245 RepID=UPI00068F390E|nr:DUF4296 domain-containing protein [Flavobacterium aquatile]OXA66587.1 hypothetical protein B0A61_10265 [Flavobacterium aquatile LMG 4008 = ATCC 11947]GEC78566.1 lipoprotein precursor [Flavobacterium aquatile]
MKKLILLFIGLATLVSSCNNTGIEKPKNLLDEDQMVNIIYDLSLLDAIRSQNIGVQNLTPTANQLLKDKYKIDSLTFAKNSQYYASDVVKYKEIYDQVKLKLDRENEKINGKKTETPVDGGIVK